MSTSSFSQLLLVGVGLCALVWVAIVALRRPWWATVLAIASLAFVPIWVGANFSVFFITAHLGLTALATAAILMNRAKPFRLHPFDLVIVALVIVHAAMAVTGLASLNQAYIVFQWAVAYTFARVASEAYGVRRIFTVVALVFAIAAVLLIIESLTATNLWTTYAGLPNGQFAIWGSIQIRGGVGRAEGAFGHSIAAGVSLAIAAVLTLDSRLKPWLRISCIAVMSLAILLTLSRLGMVTAALGLALGVVLARLSMPLWARGAGVVVLLAGAAAYVAGAADIFAESGDEAANSASYRLWILDLLPTLQPFGYATSFARDSTGGYSFGQYASIDNAVLRFALVSGWIPAILLLVMLLYLVLRVFSREMGVAGVAVVAQIPAIFSVALITQYAMVFWIAAGLAVSELVRLSPALQPDLPEKAGAYQEGRPASVP